MLTDGPMLFEGGAEVELCSTCGAADWVRIRRAWRATYLTWLLVGVPLWRRRSIWRCATCGEPQS
jgi:hypothetical protein